MWVSAPPGSSSVISQSHQWEPSATRAKSRNTEGTSAGSMEPRMSNLQREPEPLSGASGRLPLTPTPTVTEATDARSGLGTRFLAPGLSLLLRFGMVGLTVKSARNPEQCADVVSKSARPSAKQGTDSLPSAGPLPQGAGRPRPAPALGCCVWGCSHLSPFLRDRATRPGAASFAECSRGFVPSAGSVPKAGVRPCPGRPSR